MPVAVKEIEHATGLKQELLRKWEVRYGFPRPTRDERGRRVYPPEQVKCLQLISGLIAGGMRPGSIVGLDYEELRLLTERRGSADEGSDAFNESVFQALRGHDGEALGRLLQGRLNRDGLLRFVQDVLPGMTERVGSAWLRGELRVFEEHIYSQTVTDVLQAALATLPPGADRPRILLTTAPGELHTLGLTMARVVLTIEGAACFMLGAQTPVADIAAAVAALDIDVVGISASGVQPRRVLARFLKSLRDALDPRVAIWVGGRGARLVPPGLAGIVAVDGFARALAELRALPRSRPPRGATAAKS